jgi:hypothetical protein
MFDYQWKALVERRQQYLDMIQTPMTALEWSEKAGLTYDAMQNHITAFMRHEEKYIKEIKKLVYKGRHRTSYVAIREVYDPVPTAPFTKRQPRVVTVNPNPVQVLRDNQVMLTSGAIKTDLGNGVTKYSLEDYVRTTRPARPKVDARIGSTFSTMAF